MGWSLCGVTQPVDRTPQTVPPGQRFQCAELEGATEADLSQDTNTRRACLDLRPPGTDPFLATTVRARLVTQAGGGRAVQQVFSSTDLTIKYEVLLMSRPYKQRRRLDEDECAKGASPSAP